ncbi:hypothetical protein [Sorangium sp. So ce131]|uniref:hypothetical protein n=1 Tax=Sorangium sp. So ce131 TaxID=3133282 RepID=UPI003F61C373
MSQNVNLQLLHLAQRVRPRDADVARAPDPALQALSPAAPLRALVAEHAHVGGLGAVFALGDGLDALTFSPTLYLLESAASVAQLAHAGARSSARGACATRRGLRSTAPAPCSSRRSRTPARSPPRARP